MLRVRTELKNSSIHGIGIFSTEFIQKGTVTWRYEDDCERRYSKYDLPFMPPVFREYLMKYSYVDSEGFRVLCGDNARFENHSDNPNLDSVS